VAHFSAGAGNGDIHVHDLERKLDTRVTFDDKDDEQAEWSPDGRTLAVTTSSLDRADVYLVDPARPGERKLRLHCDLICVVEGWFPDGGLMMVQNSPANRTDLYRLPPGEGSTLVPAVGTPFSEYAPALTADGHWLAYVGDSTGRDEVYVRSLDSGEEWRASKEGGTSPSWRKDGRELYYVDPSGFVVAVPATLGKAAALGAPVSLFAGLLEEATGRQYDAAPDGQRFIVNRREETTEYPIVVMTGLPEDFAAARRP
jgi:Tol biopolymer transport system component